VFSIAPQKLRFAKLKEYSQGSAHQHRYKDIDTKLQILNKVEKQMKTIIHINFV